MAKKSYKILTILSIIFLLISLFFLIKLFITKNKNANLYQLKDNSNYEVFLNPSDYFSKQALKDNDYYIASVVSSIDIYFNYYLKNNTNKNINYSYDITTTLKSYAANGTKLIYSKDFNKINVNNLSNKDIFINKLYSIDYNYYRNYVTSFQNYYNIKTNSYLYITLNINLNNESQSYILFTIPLNEEVISIDKKEDHSFLNKDTKNTNVYIIYIFLIGSLILFLIKHILNKNNNDNLLKGYKDIIIVLKNNPLINNSNTFTLTNLKDLIAIALLYKTNIYNYQENYYIFTDNTYFIYKKT